MYLKRLELQGFKSFADKTILEFMPGITTVIGPNGSGKSNISDAIQELPQLLDQMVLERAIFRTQYVGY